MCAGGGVAVTADASAEEVAALFSVELESAESDPEVTESARAHSYNLVIRYRKHGNLDC